MTRPSETHVVSQFERMEAMCKEAIATGHKLAEERDRLKASNAELVSALESLLIAAVEVGGLPEYGQVTVTRKVLGNATSITTPSSAQRREP